MKEKTYYEVLEEIERTNSQYETMLELGEICFSLIQRMDRGAVRVVRGTEITLNGKNYQITIEESRPWN